MRPLLPVLFLLAIPLQAIEPMCGTSRANDERVQAIHEQTRARIASDTDQPPRKPTVRDGAFYLQNDASIAANYRPFDLAGQSLVFTPAGNDAFTMRRTALQYTEPAGAPLRDFQTASGPDWHYVAHDLPFALPLFGKSVTRIYVSAFNGIHVDVPPIEGSTHFDSVEAAVHRGAVLSPLMITEGKPRFLEYPRVWIQQAEDAVIVTWRSVGNAPFGYDLQARVATDGKVTFSYRDVVAMRWGTPVLASGFDPAQVQRALLRNETDKPDDLPNATPAALRAMLDVQKIDAYRLSNSDIYSVRVTLGAPIDRTQLQDGQVVTYAVTVGPESAIVEIGRDTTRVAAFTSFRYAENGAAAHVDGGVIEFYGVHRFGFDITARVRTYYGVEHSMGDTAAIGIPFTLPPHTVARDLSIVAEDTPLTLPIAEPFVLGTLDPVRVWDLVRKGYGLSTYDYDAVAIYQTFFTDIIWYAGAYATRGNAQVDGIASGSRGIDQRYPRAPTLLHMNQLAYNYHSVTERASQVMLHEFGHRWLYHFQIVEDGEETNALNPASSHPAAFVHTPSAFPVYGEHESSVMGGGYFTPQPDGSYKAHAANHGFSWTDLYLMGLATPEEVPPWFYLAGTDLPLEYWPAEGAIANGEKRDVHVGQIIAAHGPRIPSAALSQKQFRVLFVLVTEAGVEATDAEVAKLNGWRALMERNFATATGGRGKLITTFSRPGKRRPT
ncbi:MAG TPA: hypothetical protein VF432_12335 [Thermoanaerobaculia bacterium]